MADPSDHVERGRELAVDREATDGHWERKQAEGETLRNQARLKSVVDILQYQAPTTQAFLDFALDQAIQLTDSRIGYIYFYNQDTREFRLNTWSKGVLPVCTIADPQICYELDKTGIWGEAVRQRRPIVLNDFQAEHPLKKGYPEGHAPLIKYMTVPVLDQDRIVAVVGVANKESDYHQTDVLQLTLLMDAVWKVVKRRQVEEALRESEERYRLLAETTRDIILLHDEQGQITYVNQAGLDFSGFDRTQVLGQPITKFLPLGKQADVAARRAQRQIGEKGVFRYETEFVNQAGQRMAVEVNSTPVLREDRADQFLIVARDVSERKQAEEQLRTAHGELEQLLAEAEQSRRVLLSVIEDQKRVEEALRESNLRLSVLNRMGLALTQTLDLPTIYRTAYDYVSQLVDCSCLSLSLYDPDTRILHPKFMLSDGNLLDPATLPQHVIDQGSDPKGRARAVMAQKIETATSMTDLLEAQCGARSALYVPLVAYGRTIGLLEVHSKVEQAYGQAEIALLGTVAHQIGMAIENARLVADLEAERVSLAERVRNRTAELEAANEELEAFAYSVSHDLSAPLRTMDGFSDALLSQYEGQLDEQGHHYLERIQAASQRMGRMIHDLLDLSRVTRREMSRRRVDMTALVGEIAAELQDQEPQRHVNVDIAEGMVTQGDAHLLRLALENLLRNAWKFSSSRSPARIEVGILPEPAPSSGDKAGERPPIFFVRDNGVGFDMAYADKLFVPFQRLHAMHEFPGTGIGLVTVKRIVTRHGGRIWSEAEVDRGATFYFTLGGAL